MSDVAGVSESVLMGIIGGSGVYKMDCLVNPVEVRLKTPFGDPSDIITIATVGTVRCAFLPRHGRNHSFTPSEVNYRANIYAMKMLGVKYLLSVCAVGSLTAEMNPGDLVVVDQIIDKTFKRETTFFGNGVVGHVAFGHPSCEAFRRVAIDAVKAALPQTKVHPKACIVTMEGPQFSTKAESLLHKSWGASLIGMTSAPEAKLAREAEMAHCIVAMVTDADAWTDHHVTQQQVGETLRQNANAAQIFTSAICKAVGANPFVSEAHTALDGAILSAPTEQRDARMRQLPAIFGRFFKQ